MLVPLNKETAGIFVSHTDPQGIELICKLSLLFRLKNMVADHVSENQRYRLDFICFFIGHGDDRNNKGGDTKACCCVFILKAYRMHLCYLKIILELNFREYEWLLCGWGDGK